MKINLEDFYNIAQALDGYAVTFKRLPPTGALNIISEAPFGMKDIVKAIGFQWNPELKIWHYCFKSQDIKTRNELTPEEQAVFDNDQW